MKNKLIAYISRVVNYEFDLDLNSQIEMLDGIQIKTVTETNDRCKKSIKLFLL